MSLTRKLITLNSSHAVPTSHHPMHPNPQSNSNLSSDFIYIFTDTYITLHTSDQFHIH